MSKKNILIVDDEEVIREILRTAFEMYDFPVAQARHGKEALRYLEDHPRPGMIVLDYMMPVMDGRTFAEELSKRKEWTDIPILLVTAFPDKAQNFPVPVKIVEKPFEVDVLLDAATEYCG